MMISISIKTYYSIQHLQSAEYFVKRAVRLEQRCNNNETCQHLHRLVESYAASTLFTTVAFLEALANEIYADAHMPHGGNLDALEEGVKKAICTSDGAKEFEKLNPQHKYETMLKRAGKQKISKGSNPGQDMATVFQLRNELVHYKAVLFDSGSTVRPNNFEEIGLLKRIEGRFEPRPGTHLNSTGWISAGCAVWALKTAIAYSDEFFKELNINPIYGHVRPRI